MCAAGRDMLSAGNLDALHVLGNGYVAGARLRGRRLHCRWKFPIPTTLCTVENEIPAAVKRVSLPDQVPLSKIQPPAPGRLRVETTARGPIRCSRLNLG